MIFFFKRKKEKNLIKARLINETEFVVVDTELTGLNETKDTIIAIGGIKMKGRIIKLGEIFYRTVRPSTKDFKKSSIIIHEITPTELETCPQIEPILKEFLSFTKNCLLIGHYVSIDLSFLKREIHKHLQEDYAPLAIDTFVIYKWLIQKGIFPENFSNNNSLKDIANSLEIQPRELHNALSDAFITAQIFQKLVTYLAELKIFTVGELLDIGNPNISGYMGIIKKEVYQF